MSGTLLLASGLSKEGKPRGSPEIKYSRRPSPLLLYRKASNPYHCFLLFQSLFLLYFYIYIISDRFLLPAFSNPYFFPFYFCIMREVIDRFFLWPLICEWCIILFVRIGGVASRSTLCLCLDRELDYGSAFLDYPAFHYFSRIRSISGVNTSPLPIPEASKSNKVPTQSVVLFYDIEAMSYPAQF